MKLSAGIVGRYVPSVWKVVYYLLLPMWREIVNLPYEEGTWFAVPLKQRGYGTGVVARHSPDGSIVLAYLFGPKREHVPTLADTIRLEAPEAIKVVIVGALGLIKGTWPLVGKSSSWKREEWPMPRFVRRDDISRTAWLVTYADDNPNHVSSEQRVPFGINGHERDALCGTGSIETVLTRLLG